MKKLIALALVLLPLAGFSQTDTVSSILVIKRCNTCPMQPVSGYVIFHDCKPVGYLSGKKRPYPAKFRVCNESDFYHLKHKQ